jgi:predicted TIM-barrel fold metal-dependent hydrolase
LSADAADWHAHWLPPALLRLLECRSEAPRVLRLHGVPHLQAGRLTRPLDRVMVDIAARRDLLEQAGISWQMLSLSSLWNVDNLPAAEALPLVRAFNDATAQAVRASPRTFGGLAALPLHDLRAAAVELRRACAAGLAGAILPAEALATLSRARHLAPLLEEADRLGSHLFIHPGYLSAPVPPACLPDNWWVRRIVLDTQHQLTAAMLTLCSTPLLDDYPNLMVQVANLGGGMPFYLERFRAVAADNPALEQQEWSFDLRRVFVDSASFGQRSIGLARDVLGHDRVRLGTDMPIVDVSRVLQEIH